MLCIESAGLLVLKGNKILLLRPKGMGAEGHYSIPKGIIAPGETKIEAAIRETFEEVGLKIDPSCIANEEYCIRYVNNGIETKRVYCYVARLPDSCPDIIPIEQLQKDEVEFAAFFERKQALFLLFWRFRHLLYQIPDFDEN